MKRAMIIESFLHFLFFFLRSVSSGPLFRRRARAYSWLFYDYFILKNIFNMKDDVYLRLRLWWLPPFFCFEIPSFPHLLHSTPPLCISCCLYPSVAQCSPFPSSVSSSACLSACVQIHCDSCRVTLGLCPLSHRFSSLQMSFGCCRVS